MSRSSETTERGDNMKRLFPGLLGVIKDWLLRFIVDQIKKTLESPEARGKAQEFGEYLGRLLGEVIPGEAVDGFLASFIRGFADGLDDPDQAQQVKEKLMVGN